MTTTLLPAGWLICELCERTVPCFLITKHHLIPRSMGKKSSCLAIICVTCHFSIHHLFTNKELGKHFFTIHALQESERCRDYLEWARIQRVNENAHWAKAEHKRDQKPAPENLKAADYLVIGPTGPLRFRLFEGVTLFEGEE